MYVGHIAAKRFGVAPPRPARAPRTLEHVAVLDALELARALLAPAEGLVDLFLVVIAVGIAIIVADGVLVVAIDNFVMEEVGLALRPVLRQPFASRRIAGINRLLQP